MSNYTLGLDVGQAEQLKHALRKARASNGGIWNSHLLNQLIQRDDNILGGLLDVLEGRAIIVATTESETCPTSHTTMDLFRNRSHCLTVREKAILTLRLGMDDDQRVWNYREIGARFSTRPVLIRQIEQTAIRKMRSVH